ncbi:MAG: MFS transporter [Acidimicrobiales bacterium]
MLTTCCMSVLIVGMDVTIVNVALPSIRNSLHAQVSGLQWTIDAFTLTLAMLLMLSGSTADRVGRKRTFQVGLVTFTLGSLLCSLAPGLGWLIAFRVVQAVGGSMLNPVAMSIITNTFTEPRERARAIGVWGAAVGISLALGPVVGGVLVSSIGWRSIFWINIPIGLTALVLTRLYVPESKADRARRLDPTAQGLIVLLFGSLTYAIIEGPEHGWHSPLIIGLFIVAAVASVVLVVFESRRYEPLINPRFFRSAPFSGATIVAISAFAAFGGFLFLNTLYLQSIRGYSPLHAGLLTLPMAAMTIVCAPISGRLVGSRGPRTSLLIAGPALAIGAFMLIGLSRHTPVIELLAAYVIFGIGFGTVSAPITNTAMSGMPRNQAGVAAAITSTSRQIGASLGVAITGSLVAVGLGTRFTTASHAAWAVIGACGIAVTLIGFATTTSWAKETAEHTRVLFGEETAGEHQRTKAA